MAEEHARLVAHTEHLLKPDRNMFGIFDPAVPYDESAPMPAASEDGLLGVGKTSILIGSLQQSIAVALRLEYWTSQPPALSRDDWEDQGQGALMLPTGKIQINLITMGWLDTGGFSVPPGRYTVRVAAHDRHRIRDAHFQLLEGVPSGQVFDAGWAQTAVELAQSEAALAGQEKYLVQFWPSD